MTTPTPNGEAKFAHALFNRIAELERDLAAAQEELERVRDKCNEHYMALAAAQEENAKLKAEISRIMQAAVNGGYCRRNHAKCECENIAESIRIDE